MALDVLQKPESAAPKDQAESVAEAIIRHQDLCNEGKITAVGQLLQLATIFGSWYLTLLTGSRLTRADNTGAFSACVHHATIEDVSNNFPRMKWSHCFAHTINREIELKPWCHTTTLGIDDFPSKVLGNKLMEPFE